MDTGRKLLSGGSVWHWQAWRSRQLWSPSVQLISKWLVNEQALQKYDKLLLIGASAGWMMSNQWLCQFKEINTFDIDPLAASLFKWNHGKILHERGIKLSCHTQDALAVLPQLLVQHPNALIFFDNVLGQLRFTYSSLDATEKKLKKIKSDLQGRTWGSLHDRMSGSIERSPTGQSIIDPFHTKGFIKKDTEIQSWLMQMNALSPWLDHLTQDVFPDETEVHNLTWAFNQNYWHWLQMGWVYGNRFPL
jgi:hypothetical protein